MEQGVDKTIIIKVIKEYLQTSAFTDRKLTDTPTDDFSTVNRKYVTNHGTSANRPTSSIIGQFYYDTTIDKPIWWNGTGFKDAAGNYV